MIIGLTGYARSGKNTVANILVERYGFVHMAFADGIRDMALAIDPFVQVDGDRHYTEGNTPFARYSTVLKAIGYDAAKSHPDVRRLLQRIGTEAVRDTLGDSTWLDIMARRIAASVNQNIVITDVRFINEACFVEEMGGVIVRVVRPGYGRQTGHTSETEMELWADDAVISASTLDELTANTCALMETDKLPTGRALIAVRREGDNVVAVETGEVVATKLGTIDSDVVQTASAAEANAAHIDDFLEKRLFEPPTEFKAELHTAGDGVDPLRQAIVNHVTTSGEHDVVEQAINEHITGDVVD